MRICNKSERLSFSSFLCVGTRVFFILYIHICENRCTLSPWTRFAWSVYITISFTLIYTWSIYSMWSIKPDSNHEFIDRSAVAKLSTNKIPVQTYITLHTPMDWHLQNRSIAHKKSPLFPGRFNYIQCFLGNGEREQTKKRNVHTHAIAYNTRSSFEFCLNCRRELIFFTSCPLFSLTSVVYCKTKRITSYTPYTHICVSTCTLTAIDHRTPTIYRVHSAHYITESNRNTKPTLGVSKQENGGKTRKKIHNLGIGLPWSPQKHYNQQMIFFYADQNKPREQKHICFSVVHYSLAIYMEGLFLAWLFLYFSLAA